MNKTAGRKAVDNLLPEIWAHATTPSTHSLSRKRHRSLESYVHRKVPAWFGGGEHGKGSSTPEDTSPRSLSCSPEPGTARPGRSCALGPRAWSSPKPGPG